MSHVHGLHIFPNFWGSYTRNGLVCNICQQLRWEGLVFCYQLRFDQQLTERVVGSVLNEGMSLMYELLVVRNFVICESVELVSSPQRTLRYENL